MTYQKAMSTSNNEATDTALNASTLAAWQIEPRAWSLILILTLLGGTVYLQLSELESNLQRKLTTESDRQLVSQIQRSAMLQLEQLSILISSHQKIIESTDNDNPRRLHSTFNHVAMRLLRQGSIDFLGFYSQDKQPLETWSENQQEQLLSNQINQWINEVASSGRSLSVFFCLVNCSQYLISAYQVDPHTTTYLVASLPMSAFLDAQELPDTRSMGILAQAHNRETSTDSIVYKWGYSLHMSERASSAQYIMQEFAKKFSSIDEPEPLFLSLSLQRHYLLNFYTIDTVDSPRKNYLFMLDDISSSVISRYTGSLYFSLLLFCALTLFHSIMHRFIKDSPSGINLQNDKEQFAGNLMPDLPGFEPYNSYTIQQQLETLKKYNQDINLELAKKTISLRQEKGMLEDIQQNAQMIIMTLQGDAQILSSNGYAEKISGYSRAELVAGKLSDFQSLNASTASEHLHKLDAITRGELTRYEHEAPLRHKQNAESNILWRYSRLSCDASQEPLILTTGIDISALKKLEKNLSWLINYDSLTSLFNRRRFEKELDTALSRAKKNHSDGTLITIDLDNFTDINDSCGHKVGDIILRKVANTIKLLTQEFKTSTKIICARLGGDEFAVLLTGVDEQGAIQLSRRIIKSLNNITHMQRQVSFQLSCSIGIATFSGAGYVSNELLSNASFARNEAKLEGRNQLHTFKAEHSHLEKTHYRMFWCEKIEHALKTDGFILHFQPILNIHHSTISHYEALLRMKKENGKLVTPGLFIDIAEKSGLIQQIDSFIIASAIAKQGQLRRQGHDVTLAINLSSKAFDDPQLFIKIQSAIQSANANPEHLIFEITETGSVSNITEAKAIMTQIQSLGCKFSLDDFGIGFSSFYHLRKLPFEYVKIDGSFIRDLSNNSDNKILVEALSEVAIGFNKLTVAEFVDSMQTLQILKQAKVNFAQGYLIGKPGEKIPVDKPDYFQSKHS